MFKVSDIIHTAPENFSTPLQKEVYSAFARLEIPFERVDTDPGLTMQDSFPMQPSADRILPLCHF